MFYKAILVGFIMSLNAFSATPYHCTAWPYDGTLYADGVIYDNPKPDPCYSVMFNGKPIHPRFLKMVDGKLEIDQEKMNQEKSKEDLERQEKIQKRSRFVELSEKQDLTAAELKEAVMLILKGIR